MTQKSKQKDLFVLSRVYIFVICIINILVKLNENITILYTYANIYFESDIFSFYNNQLQDIILAEISYSWHGTKSEGQLEIKCNDVNVPKLGIHSQSIKCVRIQAFTKWEMKYSPCLLHSQALHFKYCIPVIQLCYLI